MSSQSGNKIAVNGGRSSVGRAPDCDSGGRGFNPHRPPHLLYYFLTSFKDPQAVLFVREGYPLTLFINVMD